jgi:hypothetical protein
LAEDDPEFFNPAVEPKDKDPSEFVLKEKKLPAIAEDGTTRVLAGGF